jgi:hypothetical protein
MVEALPFYYNGAVFPVLLPAAVPLLQRFRPADGGFFFLTDLE